MKHKWAKEIHAFADGAQIQWRESERHDWAEVRRGDTPAFNSENEYRVKPEPKPLWEVAQDAYDRAPAMGPNKDAWQAVADAVIAAHKEQS